MNYPIGEIRLVATGLGFLEGPVVLPDGALVVVDLRHSCVWRIEPGRAPRKIAATPGALNGAALGPDGRLYACNNGGLDWGAEEGLNLPLGRSSTAYIGGRIQAIDLASGAVEDICTACDGIALKAPNDLVFDRDGGFYFTDHASNLPDIREHGAVYYARPDGSAIRRVAFPLNHPNGIALSPDGGRLYVGDSLAGNLWYFDIEAPGRLARGPHMGGATFLSRLPDVRLFDSIAVDALGNIVAATLHPQAGALAVITPAGEIIRWIELPVPDPFVTNICFGGPGLRTAYVTAAGHGNVFSIDWPVPGLPLNFNPLP
jgi:gluconolactonase